MSDTQRTLFAGFLIALLTLTIPFYLQFIGINAETVGENNDIDNQNIVDNNEPELSKISGSFSLQEKDEKALENNTNQKTILIQTDKFSIDLSNYHGGSLNSIRLNAVLPNQETNYQYVGGYNLKGTYDFNESTLLFNQTNSCSPCLMLENVELGSSFWAVDELAIYKNGIKKTLNIMEYKPLLNLDDADSAVVSMSWAMDPVHSVRFYKSTTFYSNSFIIQHNYKISNLTEDVRVAWFGGMMPTEQNLTEEITYSQAFVAQNKEISDISLSPSKIEDVAEKLSLRGNTDWVAMRNKYFINALVSNRADGGFVGGKAEYLNESQENLIPLFDMGLSFDNTNSLKISQFVGPLDVDIIKQSKTYLDRVMNFGWLPIQPFSRSVLWILKTLNLSGLNYGVILILFAFLIRLITGPLTKKSFQSSQKMQSVQPKLKKIQNKYKKDPQRLNQEMVKLYKTEGVNPLGGCLPMLIQMPLLFSLFIVFRSTIEFRGASFFWWITDLSKPDVIFNLPFYIPIYGSHVGLLPIVLGVSMFLSQKLSMANMDSKQKPMMYMMTAFFFLLFNQFPSGLNLYYTIYNILNYFQQKNLKKV